MQQVVQNLVWKDSKCFSSVELAPPLRKWLLFRGSFTKKVSLLCSEDESVQIHVLQEGLELLQSGSIEQTLLGCRFVYTREINICLDNDVLMYAKSVLPKNANAICKRLFRTLGQKPLGNLLFSTMKMPRTSFEVAKILPSTSLYHLATPNESDPASFLWGRRSVFSVSSDQLILTEVFSPDLVRRINAFESL